jgi:outer membrane protein
MRCLQREVVRGRRRSVVARVRVAFYDVLLAEEAVRLTENTVNRIAQTLDETRKMEQAGLSSSYDVLRLEVELANVEPALRRARNGAMPRARARGRAGDRRSGRDRPGRQPGGDEWTRCRGVGAPPTRRRGATSWSAAMRQRSELRQLELMESLRQAELRAEQSEYLPRLTLFGTYSINAQQSGARCSSARRRRSARTAGRSACS